MTPPFSSELLAAIQAGRDVAAWRGQGSVGVVHLVSGILRMSDSAGSRALTSLGVRPSDLVTALERPLQQPPDDIVPMVPTEVQVTPALTSALELARSEAAAVGSPNVATTHFLLAVMRTPVDPSSVVLAQHGVTYMALRTWLSRH